MQFFPSVSAFVTISLGALYVKLTLLGTRPLARDKTMQTSEQGISGEHSLAADGTCHDSKVPTDLQQLE